jgi:hypothetical protein
MHLPTHKRAAHPPIVLLMLMLILMLPISDFRRAPILT